MWLVKQIFGVTWKILFLLNFVLTLILLFPFFALFLSKKSWYKYCFALMRIWANYLIYFDWIWIDKKQLAALPKAPYIICANHTSYLDIVLTYCIFPDYFVFMGKNELRKAPLFNIFFKDMNILVDRKSATGSHRAFLRAGAEIDKGHCVALFPEGTIAPKAPQMLPFKNGAFKLALEKQVPIVPVTFINNWNLLEDKAFWKSRCRPGIATIVIHPHIETKGMTEEDLLSLKSKVFDIINEPLKPFLNAGR
jgi:1-acyl-sn-glycerol-3-phosphate acyltransferase